MAEFEDPWEAIRAVLRRKRRITSRDASQATGLKPSGVRYHLKAMVDLEELVREGERRGTSYVAGPRFGKAHRAELNKMEAVEEARLPAAEPSAGFPYRVPTDVTQAVVYYSEDSDVVEVGPPGEDEKYQHVTWAAFVDWMDLMLWKDDPTHLIGFRLKDAEAHLRPLGFGGLFTRCPRLTVGVFLSATLLAMEREWAHVRLPFAQILERRRKFDPLHAALGGLELQYRNAPELVKGLT